MFQQFLFGFECKNSPRGIRLMISANAAMTGSYEHLQIFLSVLIAISASYAALDLVGRVTAARSWIRLTWLAGGAIAMGTGIWSMHFVGMLAFHLPIPVGYNWPIVLVSLLVAILASAFGLFVVSRPTMSLLQAYLGSVIMGLGIASMHYIGMEAIRFAAVTHFHRLLVALSVMLGMIFSFAALVLAFDLREETKGTVSRKIASATAMGAAVAAMHYVGMASASFIATAVPPDLSHAVNISTLATLGIAAVTLMLLGVAVLVCWVARQLGAQAGLLEQRVTERTRELTALNAELRKEIADRQRAEGRLQETQRELARITRVLAMGELVASISHEINQPLAAVVANGSACLRWLAMQPPNLGEARDTMTRAVADANRARNVIVRIRSVLQKAPPQMGLLDVNQLIREVLALSDNELLKGGVTVETELAADVPAVLGDRVQLQQGILNLIMNAIDAMSTITDIGRKLLIRSSPHPDGVLIQIQDFGPGLDPEQLDRIFDPFFTTKPEGIGMGLSIARSIIEAHGGRLWAASGSPQGAVFQFTLPKAVHERAA